MIELEQILEDCLRQLADGRTTVDDCLAQHPQHAAELGRLLPAAARLAIAGGLRLNPTARQQGRQRLVSHMAARPRRQLSRGRGWALPALRRLAPALAALALVLTAGTAFAQAAGPDELLYGWRLASESVWLAISPEPEQTALAVTERRAQEVLQSVASEATSSRALNAYQQWIAMLAEEGLITDSIAQALSRQQAAFRAEGLELPALDSLLEADGEALPASTPQPEVFPLPTLGLDGLPLP